MPTQEPSPRKKTAKKAAKKPASTPTEAVEQSAERLAEEASAKADAMAAVADANEVFDIAEKGVDKTEAAAWEMAQKVRSGEMTVADILNLENDADRAAAEEQIKKFLDVKKASAAQVESKEEARRFFVKCHICGGPGIFLLRNPWKGSIGSKEWFSAYKSRDSHYPSKEIICQCCALEGRTTKLRLTHLSDGRFSPYKRVRMEAHDFVLEGVDS